MEYKGDDNDEGEPHQSPFPKFIISLLSYIHRYVLTKALQNYDQISYFLRE